MRRAEHSGHGLQVAILSVTVAALVSWICFIAFLPANSDSLRVELGTLRSSAAEALTLTRADDEERAPGNFYSVELELLRKDTEKSASTLASARAEAPLRPRFAEAASLARQAAANLRQLGIPGAPAESVIAALATLDAIQTRVKQMEQELEP